MATPSDPPPVVLTGTGLTVGELVALADGAAVPAVAPEARERAVRSWLAAQRLAAQGRLYGRGTGVGAHRSVGVDEGDEGAHGLRLLRSHAGGGGAPLPARQVRAMLAVRANQLLAGGSGIQPAFVDALTEALRLGVHPEVNEYGGIGTGDLTALAQTGLTLIGERPWSTPDGPAPPPTTPPPGAARNPPTAAHSVTGQGPAAVGQSGAAPDSAAAVRSVAARGPVAVGHPGAARNPATAAHSVTGQGPVAVGHSVTGQGPAAVGQSGAAPDSAAAVRSVAARGPVAVGHPGAARNPATAAHSVTGQGPVAVGRSVTGQGPAAVGQPGGAWGVATAQAQGAVPQPGPAPLPGATQRPVSGPQPGSTPPPGATRGPATAPDAGATPQAAATRPSAVAPGPDATRSAASGGAQSGGVVFVVAGGRPEGGGPGDVPDGSPDGDLFDSADAAWRGRGTGSDAGMVGWPDTSWRDLGPDPRLGPASVPPQAGAATAPAAVPAPVVLQPGDALALLSSNALALGQAALAQYGLDVLLRATHAVAALSLAAVGGSAEAYAAAVHALRPYEGAARAAGEVRRLLGIGDDGAGMSGRRIQDPFGFRAFPQAHGCALDACARLRAVVEVEVNCPSENPLVAADGPTAHHHGGFFAAPLGLALDAADLALLQTAQLSVARLSALGDPDLTGLPAFLAAGPASSSGTMILEYTANSALAELRACAAPASAGHAVLSHGLEEAASFAGQAARQTLRATEAYGTVLACELVTAVRALRMRPVPPPVPAFTLATAALPLGTEDRPLTADLAAAAELLPRLARL
ncbi:aromatic amino acid lyase [Streptomyces sp. SS7]|uniref:aromatic amino acid lyase n=1 Tax=Streptomyces sp. SS7 TaxID=3108485 RepID=UPI0030EE129F